MVMQRSFTDPFGFVDHTPAMLVIPNQWQLVDSLGIFTEQGVAERTITLEKISQTIALVSDRSWGERSQQNKDYTRELRSFPMPHFPFDDYISPQDIQGKRAYGSDNVETLDAVRLRKLERIRNSFAKTMEVARMQLITAGTAYAPNSTIAVNYYTEFGFSQQVVDFVFGTTTTDIRGKIESGIAYIQDNVNAGEIAGNFVCLCNSVFFGNLINHATTINAYQYYSSTQDPLRTRLTAAGLDSRFREFDYGGVRFIEYRAGTSYIPAGNGHGEAYLFPTNIGDMFETYFAPANKLTLVNTLGEEIYAFEYRDIHDEGHLIQSESNFLNVLRRPQGIVRFNSSTAGVAG